MSIKGFACFFVLLVLSAGPGYSAVAAKKGKYENIKLADFDVDGAYFDVNDIEDKNILVVFWATWCKPCMKEITMLCSDPGWAEKNNIQVFLINIETRISKSKLKSFKDNSGYIYPVFRDDKGKYVKYFDIENVPAMFLYSKNKKLLYKSAGFSEDFLNVLEQKIKTAGE